MKKIKKVLFLTVFVVSLVTSSCSCEKHKNYIPADSKVLGKVDLKEFFKQADIDKDKFMQDLEEYLDDEASVEKMGLDLSVPVYIFGHGKGMNLSFGVVAKVDDRDKVKAWFEDKKFDGVSLEIDTEEKKDGFEYTVHDNLAVGLNDDALVMLVAVGEESDAKKEIKKIMTKDFEGDIDDNKLMEKIKENKSFACLYADMSIVPSEAIDIMASQNPKIKDVLNDISEMTFGIDARFLEGICDFEFWAESDKKDVQEKIDKYKKAFRKVDSKGIKTIPSSAIAGMVANVDGSSVADYIKSFLKNTNLIDELPDEASLYINSIFDILDDIDGNLAGYFVAPKNLMLVVESKNSTSRDIAKLMKESEEMTNTVNRTNLRKERIDNWNHRNEQEEIQRESSSYVNSYEENPVMTDSRREEYNSRYERSTSLLQETDDGYCYNNNMWFGNKNGALYLTSDKSMISSVFEKANKQVKSELSSFMKERKFVFFINTGMISGYTSMIQDGDAKKLVNAFSRIIDKINYVTFSMK